MLFSLISYFWYYFFPLSSPIKIKKSKTGDDVTSSLQSDIVFKPLGTIARPIKIKKSYLYTKTGDDGTSSLYSGERRSKSDIVFEALGTIDELNSFIGLSIEFCKNQELTEQLRIIQHLLFKIGAHIATPRDSNSEKKIELTQFNPNYITDLEQWIDHLDSQLSPLTHFILPGGGLFSSHLHVARTICRRAERLLILLAKTQQIDNSINIYINRLSDYLFVCARYLSNQEIIYIHNKI